MKYLLNSPVLTDYGCWEYQGPVSLEFARVWLQGEEFISAIGHLSTAELMSRLLNVPVPLNRVRISLQPGDSALVFRLLERLPEGSTLDAFTLEKLSYQLGLLSRSS